LPGGSRERRRLAELRVGNLDIRASFAVSYRELSANEATLFRRLCMVPNTEFDARLAGFLTTGASTAKEIDALLEELADMHLVEAATPAATASMTWCGCLPANGWRPKTAKMASPGDPRHGQVVRRGDRRSEGPHHPRRSLRADDLVLQRHLLARLLSRRSRFRPPQLEHRGALWMDRIIG
jgi:hypothetical protein